MGTHTILYFDFETRSTADLKRVGGYAYAHDPTTEVICMGYAIDDEPAGVVEWVSPWTDWAPIDSLLWGLQAGVPGSRDHTRRPEECKLRKPVLFVAHNAAFDMEIWNVHIAAKKNFPRLTPENTVCTMAMAYAMALPGSLERAGAAVGLDYVKDTEGSRVMKQMCRARGVDASGKILWWDCPEKRAAIYEYSKRDVEVTRGLYKHLVGLGDFEKRVWALDYRINQRGVRVDRESAQKIIGVVEAENDRLDAEMRAVTGGGVLACSAVAQLTDWVRGQGVDISGVAKDEVLDLLQRKDLPCNVRDALRLRREAAKTSTAKFQKMVDTSLVGGRVRGGYQYSGAGTRRWAGRGVQLQNLPRPNLKPDAVEAAVDLVKQGRMAELDMFYGPTMAAMSDCIRGMFISAEGHDLLAVDYANIEGRVLAWLAGEEWKLQAFRDFDAGVGPDVYLASYASAFKVGVDAARPHRQTGKTMELAFGFGGSVGAWRKMEKAHRPPPMGDEDIKVVNAKWREAHPRICLLWRELEEAAVRAVLNPTVTFDVGPHIAFRHRGSFLWCRLPSGGVLCYPYAAVGQVETPWGAIKDAVTYMGERQVDGRTTKKWERIGIYGGKWAENVTQAVARDLLAEGMLRVEAAGYHIVMHAHDEVVADVAEGFGSTGEMGRLMCVLPEWAGGLPVAFEGWRGKRYRK